MRLDEVRSDDELVEHLIGGYYADDPLDERDAEELRRAWGYTERARHASCGLTREIRILIAAAYSLGARHALEQTERWTIAPAAECDDEEQIDLSEDVKAPPIDLRNWRGWEELTDRERCDALRARPTISVREASECLWAQAVHGWDVAYPGQWAGGKHS